MAFDSSEVLIAPNGHVYVAPVGATAPADPSVDFATADTDWVECGYLTEDGLTFTQGRTTEDVNVWQSQSPVAKLVTGSTVTMGAAFAQINSHNLALALGGGTITTSGTGGTEAHLFEPNDTNTIDERAVAFEWLNGAGALYRLFFPKAVISDEVSFSVSKNANVVLPVTFTALATGTEQPFTLYSNDPAMAPAA